MKVSRLFTKVGLIIVGFVAAAVSIADLFGILTNLPWLTERIPEVTLLLIGILLTFVVFQEKDYSQKINSKIEESTNRIIKATKNLQMVYILPFETVGKLYNYVAEKLNSASKSIDDITWGSRKGYRTEAEEKAYNNYLEAIEAVCKKGTVKYREISSLTDEHYFWRSMNLIEKGYYSYHAGYYDISENTVPLMSYIIIDSKEVVLGFYRVPTLPSEGEIYLSVSQPMLVNLFKDYFETLWVGSVKIKEAKTINCDILNQIKKNLNIKE